MIIDSTDNSDYFVYKYNLSNEDKKINFYPVFILKIDKTSSKKKILENILL